MVLANAAGMIFSICFICVHAKLQCHHMVLQLPEDFHPILYRYFGSTLASRTQTTTGSPSFAPTTICLHRASHGTVRPILPSIPRGNPVPTLLSHSLIGKFSWKRVECLRTLKRRFKAWLGTRRVPFIAPLGYIPRVLISRITVLEVRIRYAPTYQRV